MIPTFLRPEAGTVTWNPVYCHPNKAYVLLTSTIGIYHGKFFFKATFDDDSGFLIALERKEMIPVLGEGSNTMYINQDWQFNLDQYEKQDNEMRVPTRMKKGWWEKGERIPGELFHEGKLDLDFKVECQTLS